MRNVLGSEDHFSMYGLRTATSANLQIRSKDGSIASTTAGSAPDTNFHIFKQMINDISITAWLEGVLDITKTSNLPADNLQPAIEVSTIEDVAHSINVRFLDVYNI